MYVAKLEEFLKIIIFCFKIDTIAFLSHNTQCTLPITDITKHLFQTRLKDKSISVVLEKYTQKLSYYIKYYWYFELSPSAFF